MRLVYAADLHGEPQAYAALVELAITQQANAVLLGGDLFAYHITAAPQLTFAQGPFHRFADLLRREGIRLLVIPGNVDRPASIEYQHVLQEAALLCLLDLQPYQLTDPSNSADAVQVVGYPYVPPTPFRLKDHERRDLALDVYPGPWPVLVSGADADSGPIETRPEHLDRLPSIEEELAEIPIMSQPVILVAHSPPYSRTLDTTQVGIHAGSRAIRAWISMQHPLLALHGHIHEAPEISGQWTEVIGSTLCINPGPAWRTGLQAVAIDTARSVRDVYHTRYGQVNPL